MVSMFWAQECGGLGAGLWKLGDCGVKAEALEKIVWQMDLILRWNWYWTEIFGWAYFRQMSNRDAQEQNRYTGSDAARVNKVCTSAYGSGQQCKVGYGLGEGFERRPCFFEDWLSEYDSDINKEEGGWGCGYGCQKTDLDLCCLQETGWKDEGARKLDEYKFFWMGWAKGIHGVGLPVAERWIEKVLEVCERETDGGEGNCRADCAELDFCICRR